MMAMKNMEYKGSVYRIRKCTLELLSLEEDLDVDNDCDEWWELMEREVRLKSTFLYCDLHKVVSNSDDEHEAFTTLASKLFYFLEEVEKAVKSRSISATQSSYREAVIVLQELLAALNPC